MGGAWVRCHVRHTSRVCGVRAQVRVSIDAHAAQKQRMSRANRISMDQSGLLSPIPFKRPSSVSIAEGNQIG